MPTAEEIERRVEVADTARSERRSAAARRVGDLADRHAELAEQLGGIERELGEVLAESGDVIEIDELAAFTDVPATELARWLNNAKPSRIKRKKPTGTNPAKTTQPRKPAASHQPAHNVAAAQDIPPARGGTVPLPAVAS
ncbi:Hypothetical protein AJAP_07370 [Amycolatopsis japonica]|uniref:Uncharacterized protein n=1 Tax=Amycolatopsis japonica TaxID=208439 RepID=A0A075UJU8_9PSEU|nr:hypothetical protein [Amycolatopsis japonica]AIG74387.1 Hypothetical protein AJAP_07370 [Amycolatopsis japonica]